MTKRQQLLGIFLAVPLFGLLMPFQASAGIALEGTQSLRSCIEQRNSLDVLLLVDESSSLRESLKSGEVGNDVNDLRVPALSSVVRVLTAAVEASRAQISGSDGSPLSVSIGLAGFGEGFSERLKFTPVSEESSGRILDAIADQAELDGDKNTEYHVALRGSLEAFTSLSESDSCRLLVWFSDGQHNSDKSSGYSELERRQINDDICGPNQIVDQLRANGVYIVATGLNRDENQLGLMRLIADGSNRFFSEATGRSVEVVQESCGESSANGEFALAVESEKLVDSLFQVLQAVPGIPQASNDLDFQPCDEGEGSCNKLSFVVDDTVASFSILATRPSSEVRIVVSPEAGVKEDITELFEIGEAPKSPKNPTLSVEPLNQFQFLITAKSGQGSSISGSWLIEFTGPQSESARATASFIGRANLQLFDQADQPLSRDGFTMSRFQSGDLNIQVGTESFDTIVEGLDVELRGPNGQSAKLDTRIGSNGRFIVPGTGVSQALSQGQLAKASSALLVLSPLGEVPGLMTREGEPVEIDFGTVVYKVLVSNGESFPTLIRVDSQEVSFKGTPKKELRIVFRGPDSASGTVKFLDALEPLNGTKPRADFNLVSSECVIPQQSETSCSVEVLPNSATYDAFDLILSVVYQSGDGNEVAGEIAVPIRTLKPTDTGRGLIAAAELLALFLLIQGLIRWVLAFLLSRFAPLSATARRVRLDASINGSGEVTINPMNINPNFGDDGFASENLESVNSFSVFGHEFRCPVARTFLHSTSAPLGLVSSNGRLVYGSRGSMRNRRQALESLGQVELALRGQWVLSVPTEQVRQVAGGGFLASAEVIAFLDPYEQVSREQQLSDLAFTITSSYFAHDFSSVLDDIRQELTEHSINEVDSSSSSVENPSRGRVRKRKRIDEEPTVNSNPDDGPVWDPFA